MSSSTDKLTRFLHAISDPTRRLILRALLEERANSLGKKTGLCATDIEQRVKLSQPTVSHHMKVLQEAQLVHATREGHWRWYRRNEKLIREMINKLRLSI
jgi:ArsR family transcriptional regulator